MSAPNDERAAFEAWAKQYGRIFLERKRPEGLMSGPDVYANAFTQEAWVGWQARAALAQGHGSRLAFEDEPGFAS